MHTELSNFQFEEKFLLHKTHINPDNKTNNFAKILNRMNILIGILKALINSFFSL